MLVSKTKCRWFESFCACNTAVDVPQVTCKALSLAYWRQAHEYLNGLRGHFEKIMNEDNKINFAYIAGKNHGRVEITHEQLNQVMKILYG